MSRKRHIGAFLLEENIGKMVFVKKFGIFIQYHMFHIERGGES